MVDLGPDLEQDSNDITLDAELTPEQVPHDVKPEVKGKMLMMQEPVRETIDKKYEKAPRYEMRPRKSKLSIDLNKPVTKEEQGLKDGSKVKTLIKPKVEADREMDDNHQVQALKQQNDDMKQKFRVYNNKNRILKCNTLITKKVSKDAEEKSKGVA
jgi:hypothetical protein